MIIGGNLTDLNASEHISPKLKMHGLLAAALRALIPFAIVSA